MLDEDDIDEIREKRICTQCVEEKFLKREITREGTKRTCSYCRGRRKTLDIDTFANYIEIAFEDHFELTSEDTYPFFERQGEPVNFMMQEAASIDYAPAEDVRVILENRHAGYDKDTMFDENPFDELAHYQDKGVRISEYMEEWSYFRKTLLTEARLFNGAAEGVLAEIFEGIESYAARPGKKVIVTAGPGKRIKALFRARAFHSDERLEKALQSPERELGPPPPEVATAGRMNAHGIGVFYGATHKGVAMAEIRPPVGSRVVIARFDIIRPLKLLDVGALQSINAEGSIFERSFLNELEKAAFLHTLAELITQPVMPDDEASEYLVTQAIADYLATRNEPELDGIIYPSVQQKGKLKKNVVLFHKAARVEDSNLPRGSKVSAYLWDHGDGYEMPDYHVYIRRPPTKKKNDDDLGLGFPIDFPYERQRGDIRKPALRVNLASIKVHHVDSVQFSDTPFSVSRNEFDMTEEEAAKALEKEIQDF